MATYRRFIGGFVFLFLVLGLSFSLAFGQDKEKTQALSSQRALSEILNPDGTLKLGTGIQGSFDPKGFKMVAGGEGRPRFVPAMPGQNTVEAGLAAAGDENWDDQFGPPMTFMDALVVAVKGTDVYVGGSFIQAQNNPGLTGIAKWDSIANTWSDLDGGTGGLDSSVYAITVSGNNIYVGGDFTTAGGYAANKIAVWNGIYWSALGGGLSGGSGGDGVRAIAVSGTDVYVGGCFTQAGVTPVSFIARWDWNTSTWSDVGGGVNGYVYEIAVSGTDVYVGGSFTHAGGSLVNYVARWDTNTSTWSDVGGGTNNQVTGMAVSGTDLYVGGSFNSPGNHIAKWDGASWSGLGDGVNGAVTTIAVSGTDVYVGGLFTSPGNYIAKWNGISWSTLGSGLNDVVMGIAMLGLDVWVGGVFTQAGGKWACVGHWFASLTIVTPNGGESWEQGSSHPIIWNTSIGIPTVRLERGITNGTYWFWSEIATVPNIGRYDWTLPDTASDNWYVRVMDAADGVPLDRCDNPFQIAGFGVTSPYGGEQWTVGSQHTITWNTVGNYPTVRIEYSINNGATWETLTYMTMNTGSWAWTIPNAVSSQCLIRVSDQADSFPYSTSFSAFSIIPVPDTLTLTSPNGGEIWEAGSVHTITWNSTGIGVPNVNIWYTPIPNPENWLFIAGPIPNNGTYNWTVPNTVSSTCRVIVQDSVDGSPFDISDSYFTIAGFAVTSPYGGEQWMVGTQQTITWNTVGNYPTVRIEYSINNGATWETLTYMTMNTGSWAWTIPNAVSSQCLIRVSDQADSFPYSTSFSAFSIIPVPAITVTSPNGGESWALGAPHNITWTSAGITGDVTITLYKGLMSVTLGTAAAASGVYPWTIDPGLSAGEDYRIRVWQAAVEDYSNGYFSLIAAQQPRKDDFVGTWDGQGVYYRNSDTGAWAKMASPATKIAVGDLDGDGIDDLIGLWPGQGGIWVRYSQSGTWAKLSSTAQYICTGDMNGDGRVDLVGTWDGQGIFYRNSITGAWVKMATPATMVTAGDIDNDGTDDLIGLWPSQGGIWVKYSQGGAWARLSTTAVHIASGDMNGDGRDDLLGTWDGQGVYYRDSLTGTWVKMASPATLITTGDIDGDAIDDLVGIWPTQGGVWVKYSSDGTWERLSSTAQDIAAGKMRAAAGGGAALAEGVLTAQQELVELPLPMGGNEEGPGFSLNKRDLSDRGPGGARFVFLEDINLDPKEEESARLTRIPGPGEAGAKWVEQTNLFPLETPRKEKEKKADAGVKIKRVS
jgi:hypothetical protein